MTRWDRIADAIEAAVIPAAGLLIAAMALLAAAS